MANFGFDSTAVEPDDNFDPLPAGNYLVHIKESEIKETRNGNGRYIQLTVEVLDGACKGRLIWDRINIENPNQIAVEIGQKHLSGICRAIGVARIQDTSELHNKPVIARVVIKPGKDGYDPSNEIKGFKPVPSGSAAQAQQAVPQQQQATGTNNATPW